MYADADVPNMFHSWEWSRPATQRWWKKDLGWRNASLLQLDRGWEGASEGGGKKACRGEGVFAVFAKATSFCYKDSQWDIEKAEPLLIR